MNIIILTGQDKVDEDSYEVHDHRYFHIRDILKLEENDSLEIGIINGPRGKATLKKMDGERATLKINEQYPTNVGPINIEIVCALPRPQTLKKVLSICATMGVSEISLIRASKVEKSYFQSPLLKEENYKKYLIEGLSQGKRTILPAVKIYTKFKDYFKNRMPDNDSTFIVTNPESEQFLHKQLDLNKNLVIAIGPEAGWNDYEINFMRESGFQEIKLSENLLRVENAVVAALAHVELLESQKQS